MTNYIDHIYIRVCVGGTWLYINNKIVSLCPLATLECVYRLFEFRFIYALNLKQKVKWSGVSVRHSQDSFTYTKVISSGMWKKTRVTGENQQENVGIQ